MPGYNIEYIWESEWEEQVNKVKKEEINDSK